MKITYIYKVLGANSAIFRVKIDGEAKEYTLKYTPDHIAILKKIDTDMDQFVLKEFLKHLLSISYFQVEDKGISFKLDVEKIKYYIAQGKSTVYISLILKVHHTYLRRFMKQHMPEYLAPILVNGRKAQYTKKSIFWDYEKQIIAAIENGSTAVQIAEDIPVHYQTILSWIHKFIPEYLEKVIDNKKLHKVKVI